MTAPVSSSAPGLDEFVVGSRLFGPLRVRADQCITFADGLLGFAGERRFVLLPAAAGGVYWLQAVEEGGLAFLLVDPFPVFPGYAVDLPDDAAPADGAPLVLAIVTLPHLAGESPTANLQGPLAIDLSARRGRQVILPDPTLSTRAPFDLHARLAG